MQPTHRVRSGFLILGWIATIYAGDLAAQDFSMTPPKAPGAVQPAVIGAQKAQPANWPATFIFTTPTGGCTSTAVGARAVLTAAHCVTDGGQGQIQIGEATPINVECDHHPAYPANGTADFALCSTDAPLQNLAFEKVGTSLAQARIGDEITLLGYGCTQEGGFDKGFGVLHVGVAEVKETPSQANLDTLTEGGAAVCFGDSGGAAYFHTNQAKTRRVIFGVNSRGDISRFSWLSSTATGGFVDWAFEWAEEQQVEICGLHVGASDCRP